MPEVLRAGEWPLIGREGEVRRVETALRRRDGSRGIVVSGQAGVGKTRLMRSAVRSAAKLGAPTSWVPATASARGIPLGALASATGELSGDPHRLVGESIAALTRGCADAVVGIDDAHLLDDLSAHVVHQLVLQGAAGVIVTIRSGEPAPDAVMALWKDGLLERLELDELSAEQTLELLELTLAGQVETGSAKRLWALSAGNPLYLRHVVEGEAEAGRLREVGGVWQWSSALGGPSPCHTDLLRPSASLEELIAARMGPLPAPVQNVLAILAAAGPLGVGVVEQVVDRDAVQRAEGAGLVVSAFDGRREELLLAHPLYGEVVVARLGRSITRGLQGRVAAVIGAGATRRQGDALRLAVLALDGGADIDSALLMRATNDAFARLDMVLAERLARAAARDRGAIDARIAVAMALEFQNRVVDADAELQALMKEALSDEVRATIAIMIAAILFWSARESEAAFQALLDAEARIDADGVREVLVAARRGLAALRGDPKAPLGYEPLLFASDAPVLPRLLVSFGRTTSLADLGRFDEAEHAADAGYAAAGGSQMASGAVRGLRHLHLRALRLAGRIADAATLADQWHARFASASGGGRAHAVSLAGQAALYAGAVRTAARMLRESASSSIGTHAGFRFQSLVHLAEALALCGESVAARAALDELEAESHPAFGFLDAELEVVRGWVEAAEGTVSKSLGTMRGAARIGASRDQIAPEAFALHAAVRLGDASAATRLAEIADVVEGPRASVAAEHAAGLATGDGGRLLRSAEQFEAMGDLLCAMDASAHAAAAFEQEGRLASSRSAASRALRLADTCEGPVTPALRAVTQPLPLTAREYEVATLAAQGNSSQQIAELLILSVRTIDAHLYRSYKKLGVSNRGELQGVLRLRDEMQ